MQEGFWTVAHELRAARVPDRAGRQDALQSRTGPTRASRSCGPASTSSPTTSPTSRKATPRRVRRLPRLAARAGRAGLAPDALRPAAPGAPLFPLDAGHHPTEWVADEAIAVLDRARPRPAAVPDRVVPAPPRAAQPAGALRVDVRPGRRRAPDRRLRGQRGLPEAFIEAMTESTGVWGPVAVPSEAVPARVPRADPRAPPPDRRRERPGARPHRPRRTVTAFTRTTATTPATGASSARSRGSRSRTSSGSRW